MDDQYGSDFISISDAEGKEYELEVLCTTEYNGNTYLAVIPAEIADDSSLGVSILKSVEEDGDPVLCGIDSEPELEAVYSQIMDQLYEDEDTVE